MSHANYQFPPSSPLHDAEDVHSQQHHNKDPFALSKKLQPLEESKHARQSRIVDLPTPDPSSSVFRSSSPARGDRAERGDVSETASFKQNEYAGVTKKATTSVSINKNFNILKSDKSVLRIPFLSNQNEFTIGRSSQTCQYNLDAKDSYISRTHVKVNYTPHELTINCIGSNGMSVVIPKSCYVYAKSQNGNEYVVVENTHGEPLSTTKTSSTSIKLTAEYSQFYIHKGESISLPRQFENVLLEISKSMVLLNPMDVDEPLTDDDEELTDDEELVLIKNKQGESNNQKPHQDLTPLNKIFSSSVPQTPSKPKSDTVPMVNSSPKRADETEEAMDRSMLDNDDEEEDDDYQTPSKLNSVTIRQPQPNKSVKFNIYANSNEPSPHKRSLSNPSKMVLTDVTNTPRRASSAEPRGEKSSAKQSKPNDDEHSERQENESNPPMLKKRKKAITRQQTPEVDNSALSLPNLSEIENILVNHLAFSRLSSTPASFLNTISASTSKLSLLQIRSILHNLKCIGIIYRQGTDAAGKPLEEEYYYMPEQDDDQGRQSLVNNVKGHGGLRSCRRTHKQYYWKKPAPIKK
ncbi:TOS4 [Candida theae]|uniref:TOS4 n=1 Tax=Candida theae TaxID=1198502 RepID=A0AAD5BEP8_9ASCO|nr:TOS4 [Candida theae]KAI5958016.1 TOS4 [Candida theae]